MQMVALNPVLAHPVLTHPLLAGLPSLPDVPPTDEFPPKPPPDELIMEHPPPVTPISPLECLNQIWCFPPQLLWLTSSSSFPLLLVWDGIF